METLLNMFYKLNAKCQDKLDERERMISNGDIDSSQYRLISTEIDGLLFAIELIISEIRSMH